MEDYIFDEGQPSAKSYPQARYILLYVSLFLASVVIGTFLGKLFYSVPDSVSASVRGASLKSAGGLSEILLAATKAELPSVAELLCVFLAPLTVFPTVLRSAVIMYRGTALGWCFTVLTMCPDAYVISSAVCYALASALIILFSAESSTSRPEQDGYIGKIKYTAAFLVMSSLVFASELMPSLIFF